MYDPEMRKDCPMRGSLGNCCPVGGFCLDAVSDEICEAVHNAYDCGFCNALKTLKEHETKQVIRKQCKKEHDDGSIDYFAEWYCPHCNMLILRGFDNPSIKFCYKCGKPILWEGR